MSVASAVRCCSLAGAELLKGCSEGAANQFVERRLAYARFAGRGEHRLERRWAVCGGGPVDHGAERRNRLVELRGRVCDDERGSPGSARAGIGQQGGDALGGVGKGFGHRLGRECGEVEAELARQAMVQDRDPRVRDPGRIDGGEQVTR